MTNDERLDELIRKHLPDLKANLTKNVLHDVSQTPGALADAGRKDNLSGRIEDRLKSILAAG